MCHRLAIVLIMLDNMFRLEAVRNGCEALEIDRQHHIQRMPHDVQNPGAGQGAGHHPEVEAVVRHLVDEIVEPLARVGALHRVEITGARGKEVISEFETTIDVRKVGLERFLYNMSRQQPVWYGLMSLVIAIAAGWGASTAFRLLREN